jgi:hypothetical protein
MNFAQLGREQHVADTTLWLFDGCMNDELVQYDITTGRKEQSGSVKTTDQITDSSGQGRGVGVGERHESMRTCIHGRVLLFHLHYLDYPPLQRVVPLGSLGGRWG